METDEDVEVKVLSESEAWNLFKDKVGDKALTSPAIQSIAMDVAKECGGLPLAIVTVGLALRNTTDTSQWEYALAELRASSTGIDNMDEVVFSCLKLSYTKLKDDTRRSCFLFCALYPEGHLIDANELINYWMWEGLLGSASTLESKRRGKIILNELRYACLLESKTHNGVELVKLHDLIRDMAITIMRTNPQCIVNAGIGVAKPPHSDDWTEDVQRVSLMRNDVKSINFKPRCPRLTSLLLQYNSFADSISQDFFDSMQGLKVLDLSYTGICFLPVSLSNLENLCALLLSHCWNLLQVPSLTKLTKLKVLDLSFSRNLTKLPHGMEHLTNLRRLDFSLTCIENLPAGLISKFTLLEDLLIAGSPVIGVSSRAVKKKLFAVGIEELISCPTLSVLHMGFAELEAFNEYAKSGNCCQLKEYKLAVGYYFVDAPMLSEKTSFAINGKLLNFMCNISPAKTGEYKEILENTAALIPRNVMELIIDHCNGIKRLSTHFLGKKCLKRCGISFCDNMECVFESEENTLSMLERMDLANLKNLRMICGKPVRPFTLINLKIISVASCDMLRSLFPRQLMLELINLEEITISYCTIMEEMIEGEEGNINNGGNSHATTVILPKLRRLMFYHIPRLRSIYNGVIVCNSLKFIEVGSCEALKRLPLGLFGVGTNHQLSSPPALDKIKGTEDWWESLEWNQPQAKHFLQPYFVKRV